MNVVLTAGGIPQPGEPLYEISQGAPKAMVELAGKPIIQWVLDALGRSSKTGEIALVGLDNSTGLTCTHPVSYLDSTGELYSNIVRGLEYYNNKGEQKEPILVVASDIPSVTTPMIDWMIESVGQVDADIYYPVITRKIMETRFPGSKRTYLHLKDMDLCGGDILAIRTQILTKQSKIWKRIGETRKSPMKQALLLGLDTLFLIATRQLSLMDAEAKISQRLGLRGKVILCPYAEIGMDIDKPNQYEFLKDYLSGGAGGYATND
jgi:GTP:adenosylcobinamide-phosphate guanylyltransferase